MVNIVAYLLEANTVDAGKQPLLGNGQYTRSRGTRHVCCDIMYTVTSHNNRRAVFSFVCAVCIATQQWGKRISAAVNQHATIEEVVVSVGRLLGCITRISHS
jgi:hypothetical protein